MLLDNKLKLALFVTVLVAKVYELSGGQERHKLHPARKFGPAYDHIVLFQKIYFHRTGSICVRTVMWRYYDFDNYCMLEYINCLEGYDVYSLAYMGRCQSNLSYLMPREDQVLILHVQVNLRAAIATTNSVSPLDEKYNLQKHKIAIEKFKKFAAPRLSRRQYGLEGIDLTKMTKEEFEALQGKTDEPYEGIIWTTTEPTTIMRRTVPYRVSLEKECDYLAFICMKAYKTGPVCGRTMYHTHHTFDNYCQLDYMNCEHAVMEVWQVAHMGKCLTMKQITRPGALANAADLDTNESWLRNDYVRT